MSTQNQSYTPSIMEIVMGGIAAVNPRQFRNGPTQTEPRGEGVEAIGNADEYLKRLHCFHRQQVDRLQSLQAQTRDLTGELFGKLPPKDMGEYLVQLTDGSKAATAVRVRDLMNEVANLGDIIQEAHALFWREAVRRNPKMRHAHHAKLHSDWSFSESKKPGGFDVGGLLSRMFENAFGGVGDESATFGFEIGDLPEDLIERLRARGMPGGFMSDEMRDEIDMHDLAAGLGGRPFGHRMGGRR